MILTLFGSGKINFDCRLIFLLFLFFSCEFFLIILLYKSIITMLLKI